jgi:hypothetical protein
MGAEQFPKLKGGFEMVSGNLRRLFLGAALGLVTVPAFADVLIVTVAAPDKTIYEGQTGYLTFTVSNFSDEDVKIGNVLVGFNSGGGDDTITGAKLFLNACTSILPAFIGTCSFQAQIFTPGYGPDAEETPLDSGTSTVTGFVTATGQISGDEVFPSFTATVTVDDPVPEPSTLGLVGSGLGLILCLRKRRLFQALYRPGGPRESPDKREVQQR